MADGDPSPPSSSPAAAAAASPPPSSSPSGRVVRVHLACRAPLPLGSHLRVAAARPWDPADVSDDPHGARRASALAGREAFRAGTSGFAGGSLGLGAGNVVDADLLPSGGRDGDDDDVDVGGGGGLGGTEPGAADDASPSASSARGVGDPRVHRYASSVEMVTCPATYPVWRTRKPVVVALTDGAGGAFRHHYRYLVVTPGADNDGAHGLAHYDCGGRDGSESDVDELGDRLDKTKISAGSLAHLGHSDDARTSDDFGSSYPATLWENPFLDDEEEEERGRSSTADDDDRAPPSEDDALTRSSSRATSAQSFRSEGTSSLWSARGTGGRGTSSSRKEDPLANLPYRTLDVDAAAATVATRQPFAEESSERSEGGAVLVDRWNDSSDATFGPYRVREGMRTGAAGGGGAGGAAGAGGGGGEGDGRGTVDAETTTSRASPSAESSCAAAVDDPEKPPQRIFIVCYHLPVVVSKDPAAAGGGWSACWSESLLASTPHSSFASSRNPHWVGTVTTPEPVTDGRDKEALRKVLAEMDCTVLFVDERVRDEHYLGFCKQVLWPAFHHVDLLDAMDPAFGMDFDATSSRGDDDASTRQPREGEGSLLDLRSPWDQRVATSWWDAFQSVNRTFAIEVAKMVRPDDVVWVHDYHLSLLPRLLGDEERTLPTFEGRRSPTKKIFFLHIPFPVSMIFKEMECGPDVLEGILHADVVGFHGFTDARHFLSCAKRILGLSHESFEGGLIGVGYGGRTVVVTMSSVSIEPCMVGAAMQLPTAVDGEADLRKKHAGKTIIVGLDVAQYLSGVGLKLRAFEKLLDDAPSWRNRLVLVQRCLVTGSRKLDEARTVREIRSIVRRIAKKYGEGAVDYDELFGSALPVDQRMALWRASDCLLNTEVRGGLNLWPLEFVYAQKDKDPPGIVIASEYSAVFGILNGALRINPFDMKATLSTIDKALTMRKEEREGRHLRDIDFSIDDLRDDETERQKTASEIQNVGKFLTSERNEQFTRLDPKSVISAYQSTSKRVIVLDFNGTIVLKEGVDSFLKRDSIGSAGDAPPQAVCSSLEKLCADPLNTVFVVSGDNLENVDSAIGNIPGLGLAASNGSCFSPPLRNGDLARTWLALDLGVDWGSVKRVALPIMAKFTARTNGSFIKVAHSSIGWSYYSCDPEFGSLQAKYLVMELEQDLAAFDVRFVNLKGIVEVIPRRLNKGIIVKKILRDVAARDGNAGVDFILCMKTTHASQYTDGAEDVADLLVKMAAGSAEAFYEREMGGRASAHAVQLRVKLIATSFIDLAFHQLGPVILRPGQEESTPRRL
ncbi:hypothetical protein ACHAWF_015709, partial [Thalassiosira exigua]